MEPAAGACNARPNFSSYAVGERYHTIAWAAGTVQGRRGGLCVWLGACVASVRPRWAGPIAPPYARVTCRGAFCRATERPCTGGASSA
jgi:hypothetical protein